MLNFFKDPHEFGRSGNIGAAHEACIKEVKGSGKKRHTG